MANMLARLGVVLGLDSAEFVKGIASAQKEMAQFAQKAEVYGKVGATAFVSMTIAAMKYADEISDTAKANDVAIDTIVKLSDALSQNGGEAKNAGKLLSSFTAFVDNAAQGSFQAQQSFQKTGVSLKDLAKMSTEDLFQKTIQGIAAIEDPLTRAAKGMEIFGKAGKGVDFVGLAESMAEVSRLTDQQVQSIKDAGDAWDKLAERSHQAMLTFTAFIGTPMLKMVEYLDELPKYLNQATIAWEHMGDTIAFVNGMSAAVIMRDFESLKRIAENYKKIKADIAFGAMDFGRGEGWEEKEKAKDTTTKRIIKPGVDKEAEAIQHTLNKLKEKQAAEQLSYETKQKMFEIDQAGRFMLKEDVTLAKEIYEINAKKKVMIDEINRTEKISPKQKEELVKAENDIADAAERQARARAEISRFDRTKTFGQGFTGAMEKFFREAPNQMELGGKAFESVVGNMDAALTNFVRTGKLSFSDLTRSIIQDLIAIQMRSQMMSMFKGLFSMSNVGGVTGPDNIDIGGGWSPAGKAGGGDVAGGMPYYVGERGPELFVPNGNGTIVPSDTLAGAMGGGQAINYNGPYIANMSAIDTQSALQFLSKNKQGVWAANQSAQRSLPASR